MNDLISILVRHGYAAVAIFAFLEAIGFPLPAGLVFIAAGAAAALHQLRLEFLLLTTLGSILLGDTLLFFMGRYTGWALLGFLCRVSLNPETCILRSAESFYKRGKITLVIAKFLPGINTMAPPLAGSMKMGVFQFLRLDFLGALVYSSVFIAVGFIFSDFLEKIGHGLHAFGTTVEIIFLLGLLGYLIYRAALYSRHRVYRVVPRVQVSELSQKLQDESDGIVIADVRSHGYYDSGAHRIQGSIRLEPNRLNDEMAKLPKNKLIYLYCTCLREATSARVGHILRENGFDANVIVGGLKAWTKAGYPLESVPPEDVVLLPTFN